MATTSPRIQSNYLHAVGKNYIVPANNHPNDFSFKSYDGEDSTRFDNPECQPSLHAERLNKRTLDQMLGL